jgi:hypothetical protein
MTLDNPREDGASAPGTFPTLGRVLDELSIATAWSGVTPTSMRRNGPKPLRKF